MPSKRISGQRDCQEFLSKHPELAPGAKGERAHVVYYKRDKHTNEVVSVALTEYGRYLARA